MKSKINLFDYMNDILKGVRNGVLLTTKAGDKVNSMTISWGTIGIEWGKPIFTTFVREHRFTREQLEKNPEFTVNIPYGEFNKKILGLCGSKSGRDMDKIKELGLTLVEADAISVPAIKELPLTLECRVIYKQKQGRETILDEENLQSYPQDVESTYHGANKDFHFAYSGEIVSAYIIK